MPDTSFFAVPGGTRVERTFAFIDLSGFTTYTDTEGDSEAVKVLSGFRAAVREVAALRAVRVAKWLGDGAMLVSVDMEPAVVYQHSVLVLVARANAGILSLHDPPDSGSCWNAGPRSSWPT